jgi:predicted membrane chloride channel (bestrophin family)
MARRRRPRLARCVACPPRFSDAVAADLLLIFISLSPLSPSEQVSYVEFPFALRQLLAVLLTVFSILAPMCLAAFINDVALVSIMSFFVTLGYIALNETARELECPYGLDANDLTLTQWQKDFNAKLAGLLDLSMPQLGYSAQQHLEGLPPS